MFYRPGDPLPAALSEKVRLVGRASSLSAHGLPARGTACLAWGWKPGNETGRRHCPTSDLESRKAGAAALFSRPGHPLPAALSEKVRLVGQASSLSAHGLPARGPACLAWGWKPGNETGRRHCPTSDLESRKAGAAALFSRPGHPLPAALSEKVRLVGQASSLSAHGLPARGTACLAWGWKPRNETGRRHCPTLALESRRASGAAPVFLLSCFPDSLSPSAAKGAQSWTLAGSRIQDPPSPQPSSGRGLPTPCRVQPGAAADLKPAPRGVGPFRSCLGPKTQWYSWTVFTA